MTRTGTPIILTNIHGREDRYLLLRVEGNAGLARDGFGKFQAIRRKNENAEWTCVKVPQADEAKAWKWAIG